VVEVRVVLLELQELLLQLLLHVRAVCLMEFSVC
jgi:hypothetical protein